MSNAPLDLVQHKHQLLALMVVAVTLTALVRLQS
jgi:hypothetical protein